MTSLSDEIIVNFLYLEEEFNSILSTENTNFDHFFNELYNFKDFSLEDRFKKFTAVQSSENKNLENLGDFENEFRRFFSLAHEKFQAECLNDNNIPVCRYLIQAKKSTKITDLITSLLDYFNIYAFASLLKKFKFNILEFQHFMGRDDADEISRKDFDEVVNNILSETQNIYNYGGVVSPLIKKLNRIISPDSEANNSKILIVLDSKKSNKTVRNLILQGLGLSIQQKTDILFENNHSSQQVSNQLEELCSAPKYSESKIILTSKSVLSRYLSKKAATRKFLGIDQFILIQSEDKPNYDKDYQFFLCNLAANLSTVSNNKTRIYLIFKNCRYDQIIEKSCRFDDYLIHYFSIQFPNHIERLKELVIGLGF